MNCTDIDECVGNSRICDELVNCTNTVGSYYCGDCPNGYSGNATVCLGMSIFVEKSLLYIL